MTDKNESLIRYVVITNHGNWGRPPELLGAMKNDKVNAFNSWNTTKDSKTPLAHVYRLELDPVESRWSDETKAELKRCRVNLTGYENGDLIEPWVDDWGSLQSWGATGEAEKVIATTIRK